MNGSSSLSGFQVEEIRKEVAVNKFGTNNPTDCVLGPETGQLFDFCGLMVLLLL